MRTQYYQQDQRLYPQMSTCSARCELYVEYLFPLNFHGFRG